MTAESFTLGLGLCYVELGQPVYGLSRTWANETLFDFLILIFSYFIVLGYQ